MKNILMITALFCSLNAVAVTPGFSVDPYSHLYTAAQTFTGGITLSGGFTLSGTTTYTGLSAVDGSALCLSSSNVLVKCAAASATTSLIAPLGVFATSVSTAAVISPATGGADNILIRPAGTTAMTVAEGGDVTIVGDLTVTGNDVTANNLKSAATGGTDDITISPAGTASLTTAEAGNIQINRALTVHTACAAAGDVGKVEVFNDGAGKVSFCGCWQSAADTYAWVALHTGGSC